LPKDHYAYSTDSPNKHRSVSFEQLVSSSLLTSPTPSVLGEQ